MSAKKSPPDDFLRLAADMRAKLLAAKAPEWRRAWMDLPAAFRETLFVNAGLRKSEAGEPLKAIPAADLNKLVVAAGRYADYCRRAEAWLLKEREARG